LAVDQRARTRRAGVDDRDRRDFRFAPDRGCGQLAALQRRLGTRPVVATGTGVIVAVSASTPRAGSRSGLLAALDRTAPPLATGSTVDPAGGSAPPRTGRSIAVHARVCAVRGPPTRACRVQVGTPSRLELPRLPHATSTTAAAVLFGLASSGAGSPRCSSAHGVCPGWSWSALPVDVAAAPSWGRGRRRSADLRAPPSRKVSPMTDIEVPPHRSPRSGHRSGSPAAVLKTMRPRPVGEERPRSSPRRSSAATCSPRASSRSC
jgi:hypothetical protein